MRLSCIWASTMRPRAHVRLLFSMELSPYPSIIPYVFFLRNSLSLTVPTIIPPLLSVLEGTNHRIEEITKELQDLARTKPLSGGRLDRVKELMRKLREAGFTNLEVSELTGHAWSEPTVKLYTRGITVRDPVPKQKAIELLADLAARGMTLEQVQQAILMKRDLEAKELSIDDVSRFLNEIRKANADLKGILTMYGQLISSGIGVQQLAPLLSYRSKLEAIGITPSGLVNL